MKPLFLPLLCLFSFVTVFSQTDNFCPCELPEGQEPMIRWADLNTPQSEPLPLPLAHEEPVEAPLYQAMTQNVNEVEIFDLEEHAQAQEGPTFQEIPAQQAIVQNTEMEEATDAAEEVRENRSNREHVRKKRRNRRFRPNKRGRAKRYRSRCPRGF